MDSQARCHLRSLWKASSFGYTGKSILVYGVCCSLHLWISIGDGFCSVTNVGLEHLAASGEPWAPMDFEHVGISMLFFDGGMLGMLIESSYVHRLLNRSVFGQHSNGESASGAFHHSLSPMPALTICLLGYIMSSHTQHSYEFPQSQAHVRRS